MIPEDDIAQGVEDARSAAASRGIHLNLLAAGYVAAATTHRLDIWFGHDRNVPTPIREGWVPEHVRYRLLSELAAPPRPMTL